MSKQFFSGMRGAYAVAAELSRLEFIVSPTSRSAKGADLLVTDANCRKTFSVQVKFDRRGQFWPIREALVSAQHVYVFVTHRDSQYEFFVVPSQEAAAMHRPSDTGWGSIVRSSLEPYRDKWEVLT